jgi:c-di-GMP-related signal transduction protein
LTENSLPKDKIVVSVNNDYIYKAYFLHSEMTLNMQEYTMNMEDLAEIKSIINIEP